MAESTGGARKGDLSAARILTLHAEHRDGLHAEPVPECIQCTFDGLVRPDTDDISAVAEAEAS